MAGEATARPGFWGRATLAAAFALYGWSMMAIQLYLRVADPPQGASRALAVFRRLIMGRGVVGLGAAAMLVAIVLAVTARRDRAWSAAALLMAAGWIALFVWLLPAL